MAARVPITTMPMGEVQHEGEVRDTFVGLSRESAQIGEKLGIAYPGDPWPTT